MLWVRQIIFIFYTIIITVTFALIIIISHYLKCHLNMRIILVKVWSRLICYGMLCILFVKYKIGGKKNIKSNYIYLSKHQSEWETIAFYSLIPNSCFVLKKELLNIPLLGAVLKYIDSIPIGRMKSLKACKIMLENGKNRLLKGLNIILFPEGSRVNVRLYPKFHKTALILAKMTKKNIIPVAHNSGLFWPKSLHLIKPGCVTVYFCKAIKTKDYDNMDTLNTTCHKAINNIVKQLSA